MSVMRYIQAIRLVGFCFLFLRCLLVSAGWLKFNHSRMRKEEGLSMLLHKKVRVDPRLDL